MSSSGQTSVLYTVEKLIKMALRKLAVLSSGQVPSAQQYEDGIDAFNLLIGDFKAENLHLWKRKEVIIPLVAGVSSYSIGTGQTIDIPYPTTALQMIRKQSNGGAINMELLSNYNFNMLPAGSMGLPVSFTYVPLINKGMLQVWPMPTSDVTDHTYTLTYQAPIEIVTAIIETIDFPEEYYTPIVYGLAHKLAPEYGLALADRQIIEREAMRTKELLVGYGNEMGSLYFYPVKR